MDCMDYQQTKSPIPIDSCNLWGNVSGNLTNTFGINQTYNSNRYRNSNRWNNSIKWFSFYNTYKSKIM